jgi:hypothetical protein
MRCLTQVRLTPAVVEVELVADQVQAVLVVAV